jgi:hypothetical protein
MATFLQSPATAAVAAILAVAAHVASMAFVLA